jgi:peptidoglycan/LPS O-acetylase OafA/YrhL
LTAQIPDGAKTLMVALPGQLDWFAIGMALAILRAELEAGRAASSIPARLGRRTGRCLLLAVAAYVAAAHWQHGDLPLFWYGLATHVALGVGAGLLVLPVVVPRPGHGRTLLVRLLSHPAAVWVGTVSYGIYLWHLPIRDLLRLHVFSHRASSGMADALLRWIVVLAGSLLLAAASWYLAERPLQRALRARERRSDAVRRSGRGPNLDAGVQLTTDRLNPPGVAADHLA